MNKTAIKTGFPIGEYLSIASPSFVLENSHPCSFGLCAGSSIRILFSNQNLINRIYVTLLNWKPNNCIFDGLNYEIPEVRIIFVDLIYPNVLEQQL